MKDYFLTIATNGQGLYKEKGSKFLAFAYPVTSVEQVQEHLTTLRKTYHDARHHCYAYILGINQENFRANDDGEPNHSAGDPILGQLKAVGVTNTILVVVRYFGGTKLGVGGLKHAYKTAAEEALKNCKIIKQPITIPIELTYPYESTSEITRLIHKYKLQNIEQSFAEKCQLKATLLLSKNKEFYSDLQLLLETGHKLIYSKS